MKGKLIKCAGIFLMLFVFGNLMNEKPCLAASADVKVTADSTEVTVGDSIFVYITIQSDTEFGNFEANITYDDSILEYTDGASVIKGGSGFLKISDLDVLDGEKSRKYTLKFEALKVGICDFSFNGAVMVYNFDSGDEMPVSNVGLSLNVKAPVAASDNAALKSLKLSQAELSPAFDPDIHEYSAKVDAATKELFVNALTQDSEATVSIKGNEKLIEGENKVTIRVTAESGAVIEYTVNVIRESAPEVTAVPDGKKNSIQIENIDGKMYAVFSGRYQITEADSSMIPEGYQSAGMMISGEKISIYVPNDDMASDFVLIYAINDSGAAGFYQYDKIEKTIQRYVAIQATSDTSATENTNLSEITEKYNSNLTKAAIVIAILCTLCAFMIVISVRLLLKSNAKREHRE